MTIFRAVHNKNYVVVKNSICSDARLSLKAKGLWLYAFSKPDDWVFNLTDMINNCNDGRDAVRSALKELMAFGYLLKDDVRNGDGKFGGVTYSFYEDCINLNPETKKLIPKTENPTSVNPTSANPPLLSIDSLLSIEEQQTGPQEKQASKSVVVSLNQDKKEYKCLEGLEITISTKEYLIREFSEQTVIDAVASAKNKPIICMDAFLREGCKRGFKPNQEIPMNKSYDEQDAKDLKNVLKEQERLKRIEKNEEKMKQLAKKATQRPTDLKLMGDTKISVAVIKTPNYEKVISFEDEQFEKKYTEALKYVGCQLEG